MGDAKLPGIAAEDIGRCAYGIFKRGDAVHRQDGRHRRRAPDRRADGRGADPARSGQRGALQRVPPEVYRGFGFPGADDLGNMFQFKRDFERDFCGARDPALARALNPALQTFDRGWRPTRRASRSNSVTASPDMSHGGARARRAPARHRRPRATQALRPELPRRPALRRADRRRDRPAAGRQRWSRSVPASPRSPAG